MMNFKFFYETSYHNFLVITQGLQLISSGNCPFPFFTSNEILSCRKFLFQFLLLDAMMYPCQFSHTYLKLYLKRIPLLIHEALIFSFSFFLFFYFSVGPEPGEID